MESMSSCASAFADNCVDMCDSFGVSNSPDAFSKHGMRVATCGVKIGPEVSIISAKVFMLSINGSNNTVNMGDAHIC